MFVSDIKVISARINVVVIGVKSNNQLNISRVSEHISGSCHLINTSSTLILNTFSTDILSTGNAIRTG